MSVPFAATLGPTAYWYLARGTGVVALLLLTASVIFGVLGVTRFAAAPRWPRFAIDALHRDTSLLVLVVLVIHILTSVLDGYAPITLLDGVIPFASPYRSLWLGLGAVSFDLLIAVALTSAIRRRLGYKAWRAVHWLAYASWPVAVLHGLGTGSDVKQWWLLALTGTCVLAVLIAVWVRIGRIPVAYARLRAPATALSILAPAGLAIFTVAGPLEPGWARRAGTPTKLIASSHKISVPRTAPPTTTVAALKAPFTANLSGTLTETQAGGGAIINLALNLSGGARGQLRVRLGGAPIGARAGLSLTGSQVDLLAAGLPSVMQGRVVSLEGDRFLARVTASSGAALDLRANLQINGQTGAVSGTLSASAAGSGG